MSAQSDPRHAEPSDVDQNYYYRRSLTFRELVPAIGAAVAAAAATFYVAKLFMERTPLRVVRDDIELRGNRGPSGRHRAGSTHSRGKPAARNLGRR